MYSQTSSSVQLEIGNTLTFSPCLMRPLYRFHNSGRCFFGSHCPKSSRKENTRSFARARSSSRRAPPKGASKPCSARASDRVTGAHLAPLCPPPLLVAPRAAEGRVEAVLGERGQQRHRLQPVARSPRPRLLDRSALVDRKSTRLNSSHLGIS